MSSFNKKIYHLNIRISTLQSSKGVRITIVENYVISKLCVSLKITKLIKKNKM